MWAHDCSGIVYLDSYFFVMDTNAVIYNSALNDPTTWDALDIITAEKEPGRRGAGKVAELRDCAQRVEH